MASVDWFIIIAVLSALAFFLGRRIGMSTGLRAGVWVMLAMAILATWTWLSSRPDVAIQAIPVNVLCYLEGTAGTPIFMLILGIAWARSRIARQKRVTGLAMALGVFYFLTGGMWMLQTTPQSGFAQTIPSSTVMQSQDFSCVPASCATALNRIKIPTTESQMAELTQTRPGTGATLLRAADGLRRKLDGTPWHIELIDADMDQLETLPCPILTPLQFESSRRHMVVVIGRARRGLLVADPVDGVVWTTRHDFAAVYIGQVIVFRH